MLLYNPTLRFCFHCQFLLTCSMCSQIELIAQTHVSVSQSPVPNLTCGCTANSVRLHCVMEASPPQVPPCKCTLPKSLLPADGKLHFTSNTTRNTPGASRKLSRQSCLNPTGLHVSFHATLWTVDLSKQTMIYNCSNMIGPHTSSQ